MDFPHMPRNDGRFERTLDAIVHTWRDVDNNRVGFVYRHTVSNKAVLVYFSLDDENALIIRMHRTTVHIVEDPQYINNERLDTTPDPEHDEVLKSYEVSREMLGF